MQVGIARGWAAVVVAMAVLIDGNPATPPPPALPLPASVFAAGVMVVTQESLDKAPQKYPQIVEQLMKAATEAQNSALTPYMVNSSSLNGCGDFSNSTAAEVQWVLMLGRTQKSVQYVPNSIGMLIVADGINVSMQMNTSFTTPVWAGACAGGLIVKDPQQYPQILSALFNASAQLEQVVAAGIPTESQFVTCGLSYFVCGGNDTINGLCDPPVVTILPQNQSLVARANPASPKDSYIVTMNVSVTMKVQMGGEADVPVTSTCLTIVSCGMPASSGSWKQYATVSAVLQVTVLTTCISCPLRGGAVDISYIVSAKVFDYVPNTPCNQGPDPLAGMETTIEMGITTALQNWLDTMPDDEKMLSCGCKAVCPGTWPVPAFGTLSGKFLTNLTTTVHVTNHGTSVWPAGPIEIRAVNATSNSTFTGPLQICNGTGDSPDFYGNGPLVEKTVTDTLASVIQQKMAEQALSYDTATEVQLIPPHPIWAQYNLSNVDFVAGQTVTVQALASLFTKPTWGEERQFLFTDRDVPERQLYPPPGAWRGRGAEPPINGLRITSEFLSGVVELANDLGYFKDGFNTSFLDADLLFNVTFQQPTFSVQEEGDLNIFFPRGRLYCTCMNSWLNTSTATPAGGWTNVSNLGNMFNLIFTNITAYTSAEFISTDTALNLTMNVTGWSFEDTHVELIVPKIPLPQQFMQTLALDVVKKETPRLNEALRDNPFQVPSNIAILVHHPVMHIEPQAGCCANWSHGYLELDDFLQPTPNTKAAPPTSPPAVQPDSQRLDSEPASIMQSRRGRSGDGSIAVVFYGSAFSKNLKCHLGAHGDEAMAIALTPTTECSPVVPTTGKAVLYYTLTFTDGGAPVLTLSPTLLCAATCVLCAVMPEQYSCYNLTSAGSNDTSNLQSVAVVPNDVISFNQETEMLEGPLGAPVVSPGTIALVAWDNANVCGLGNALSAMSAVHIGILQLTSGCAAMPPIPGPNGKPMTMYYTAENDTTTGTLKADLDCPSSTCAQPCVIPDITSPWAQPTCKFVSIPPNAEATLMIQSKSLRVYPIPPPTAAPTSIAPTPPPPPPTAPTSPPPPPPPPPPSPSPSGTVGGVATTAFIVAGSVLAAGLILYACFTVRNWKGVKSDDSEEEEDNDCPLYRESSPQQSAGRLSGPINSIEESFDEHSLLDPDLLKGFRSVQRGIGRVIGAGGRCVSCCVSAMGACMSAVVRAIGGCIGNAGICAASNVQCCGGGVMTLSRSACATITKAFECPHQPVYVIHQAVALLLLSTVLAAGLFSGWQLADPFDMFTSTILSRIGLTGDHLSANQVTGMFHMWSMVGKWAALVVSLVGIGLSGRMYHIRTFHLAMPLLWVSIGILLAGVLVPPFTFLFSEGFVFHPARNSSLARSDPTIVADIESVIGIGFASVAFSWYAMLFSLVALGLPAGCFFSSCRFVLDVLGADNNHGKAANDVLTLQFGRVEIILWMAHVTAPLIQILSVIVLYQVTGSSGIFLLVWFLLWGCTLALVWRTSHLLQHDNKDSDAQKKRQIKWICAAYAITFTCCYASILALLESLLADKQYIFFASLTVTTTVLVTTASYIALHREYVTDSALLAAVDCLNCGMVATGSAFCGSCSQKVCRGDPLAPSGIVCPVDDVEHERLLPSSNTTLTVPNPSTANGMPLQGDNARAPWICCDRETQRRYCTWCGSAPQKDEPGGIQSTDHGWTDAALPESSTGHFKNFAHFMLETREQQDPGKFGKRLPGRRLWLTTAVICLAVYLFKAYHKDINDPPEKRIADLTRAYDQNLTWPSNGTAFNNLLQAYGDTSILSDYVCLVGWGLLVLAPVAEVVIKPGAGLLISQFLAFGGCGFLFIGVVLPAFPNYVADLAFDTIFPFCASEFNNFVDRMVRNLVGLFCSGFFAAALFVMLLSVSPALVRVTKYILVDGHLQEWITFQSPMHLRVFKRNLLIIMAWGSMLAPLLCLLPMLIFFQFYGDPTVGVCFVCFAMLPIGTAFCAREETVLRSYIAYLLFYFAPLAVVLGIESQKHHFGGMVTQQLKDPMTYVEIAAEVALANVVVSDVIYLSLARASGATLAPPKKTPRRRSAAPT